MRRFILTLGVGGALISSCVNVDPEPALDAVQKFSAESTGTEVVWVRTEEEEEQVAQAVKSLIEGGLSRDGAARIAVLNDPALQARLADLGIAAAEVAQASLPRNPTVDFYWAIPTDSGNTALGITGWLSDLWTLPRRKKVAQMDALIVQYEVALDVMRTAMGAAAAWDKLVAARQDLDFIRDLDGARGNIATRRSIRFAHGIDDGQLLQTSVALHSEQLAAVEIASQRLTRAENELERRLALKDAAGRVATDLQLEPYAARTLTLQQVLDLGMSERLDLALAQAALERQARQVGLEDVLAWDSVALGIGSDGRFKDLVSSEASLGPIVSIEVPIFDRNQAGKARARYELQQAEDLLRATQWAAATDLDSRYQAYERARKVLELLEDSALPAALSARDYAREWGSKMQLPYVRGQEAELDLLMIRMERLRACFNLNQAWRDLQMALRGALME